MRANTRKWHVKPRIPIITIFVRHKAECKYAGNEFFKACRCRKHFRWSIGGKQYRKMAGTRSWTEAEELKLQLQAQLTGTPIPHAPKDRITVAEAVETFMAAKRNDGLEKPTLQKLDKTTARIQDFATASGVYALEDINLTHITTWPWTHYFGTTHSLRTNQERVKSFFRYFHNAGVIAKNPAAAWKRITGKVEQVSGFTSKEYEKIVKAAKASPKLHAIVQLMRFGGLAIIDALPGAVPSNSEGERIPHSPRVTAENIQEIATADD
jgi:hypothetical protein